MNKGLAGSAIVLTVIAVVAMSSLLLGAVTLIPREYRALTRNSARLQAQQAAWAGVEHGLVLLTTARQSGQLLVLSQEMNDSLRMPYSREGIATRSCRLGEEACLRWPLGNQVLSDATPLTFDLDSQTKYSLRIWHGVNTLGNPDDLTDGWSLPAIAVSRHFINRNGVLAAGATQVFDMQAVGDEMTVTWQPQESTSCTHALSRLRYEWLNGQGVPLSPGHGATTQGESISVDGKRSALVVSRLALGSLLSTGAQVRLRFVGDAGCFIRFALEPSSGGKVDIGFDVIESTGIRGITRHKIRLLVGRENARVLGGYEIGR